MVRLFRSREAVAKATILRGGEKFVDLAPESTEVGIDIIRQNWPLKDGKVTVINRVFIIALNITPKYGIPCVSTAFPSL